MDEENKLETAVNVITETEPTHTEESTTDVVTPTIEDLQKQIEDYKIKTTIPETYDLSKIETLQEQDVTAFSDFAKKTNLTQTQAVEVASEYTKMVQDQHKQAEEFHVKMKADATTALKEAFGDKADTKLAGAQKLVKDFGGEKLATYLDDSGLGNNVDLIHAFVKISESLGEDAHGATSVKHTTGSNVLSPADARKKLREIYSTKKGRETAYNPLDPNAKSDMKDIVKLAELAAQKD